VTKVTVNSTADLITALSKAQPGETILLGSGTYSAVYLYNLSFSKNVIIESASAAAPAVITDLTLNQVSGLTFNDLVFSTIGAGVGSSDPKTIYPFTVDQSSNISFTKITASGDPNGTLADQVSGLQFDMCTNCSVSNSKFSYFHNAISDVSNTGMVFSKNSFSWLFDDGIRSGASSNVTITGNTFTDMHYDPTDTDHPDCIQFWTQGTTAEASNITITNNTYTRGSGGLVHGIFMKDEEGDLPFQNVVISGNKITGGGWQGISVTDANNLSITNNVIKPYADATSYVWVQNATGATVTGNTAGNFVYTNDPGLIQANNTVVAPAPVPAVAALAQAMAGMHAAGGGMVADSRYAPATSVGLMVVRPF
jgi:hypothetical protein